MEQLEMEHETMAHTKTIWVWNTIVDNAVFCTIFQQWNKMVIGIERHEAQAQGTFGK